MINLTGLWSTELLLDPKKVPLAVQISIFFFLLFG